MLHLKHEVKIETKQFLFTLEMKNIGEQGKENKENEINTDDEVETDRGEHNEGIYDDSLPSSVQNNNASTSGILDIDYNLLARVPHINSQFCSFASGCNVTIRSHKR